MSIHERVRKLEAQNKKQQKQIDWLIAQLKEGMTELATVTVTKILEEGLEAVVSDDTTEKIKELVERPLQCFEGGNPETCSCPDHSTALIDYEGE